MAAPQRNLRLGVAGWSIDRRLAAAFPADGSHLARYARVFSCVEINSSFYRPHRRSTYARWAEAVPDGFRFAVKMPREITHDRALVGALGALDRFLDECAGLGGKLGPLLVQLPGSFAFPERLAGRFFARLRERTAGPVVCEPRHASWFAADADRLLAGLRIARVAADPARVPEAAEPGGWDGLAYHRLHGSPVIYRSAYAPAWLDRLAGRLRAQARGRETWCIFDNTTLGAAIPDALSVMERLAAPRRGALVSGH